MNDPDLLGDQVRAWIDAHFDPGMSLHSWLELLADSGWAAPAWPAAWYGKGIPVGLTAVAIAEFGATSVPGAVGWPRVATRRANDHRVRQVLGLPEEPGVSRDVRSAS